ncbi:hypothetical protein CYMTET_23496 [Cymbomonas tetramitiformis]|uniref:Uncharacterized protein n=1 Tax=Cymbomonas tetramitiformis TaxID=36881 RepID=A0AAE0L0W3_9CHLO|nr:hypothetical protein CYMTET_23496 [Cymbomonas tetramitiformis]
MFATGSHTGDVVCRDERRQKIDDEITMRQSVQVGAPPQGLRRPRSTPAPQENTQTEKETEKEMDAFMFDDIKTVTKEPLPELELQELEKRESLIPINIRGEDVQRELWTKHARAIYSLQYQVRVVNEKYEKAMADLRKERIKSESAVKTVWEVATELACDITHLKQRSEDPSASEEKWYKKILPTMYQKTVGALQESLEEPIYEENALFGDDAAGAADLESDVMPLTQHQEPQHQEPRTRVRRR